jgi:hypothetical protein
MRILPGYTYHGTTVHNRESLIYKDCFGERAWQLPVLGSRLLCGSTTEQREARSLNLAVTVDTSGRNAAR